MVARFADLEEKARAANASGRLTTELLGITMENPVIPASGTFGYGYEFAELYDIDLLGSFSFKGTTRDPRFGNETPRIAVSLSVISTDRPIIYIVIYTIAIIIP